jgi:8-oxo-dGTP diphosphatase
MDESETIKVGVGAVVFRGADVLLIKRGKAPFKGQWSIPGGGLDYGEAVRDGLLREIREETGVEVNILGLLDVFEALPRPEGGDFAQHVVLIDYVCEWQAGEPVAGDDAAEAEFVPVETALERLSWDKTREAVSRAVQIRQRLNPKLRIEPQNGP